jgi:hypothetical protein
MEYTETSNEKKDDRNCVTRRALVIVFMAKDKTEYKTRHFSYLGFFIPNIILAPAFRSFDCPHST